MVPRRHHGHLGGNPAAERRAHEVHLLEPEVVQEIEIVEREIRDVLDPLRRGGASMSRMAWHLYREVLRERRLEVEPASGSARAVEKQQRRAGTLRIEMHGGPAHGDLAQGGRVAATSVVHVNLLVRRRRVCVVTGQERDVPNPGAVDSSASTVTGQRAENVV